MRKDTYETPEILEIGNAEELTLGTVPGDMDGDNCDKIDGNSRIAV